MELELTVSEIAGIFKQIHQRTAQVFDMILLDIKKVWVAPKNLTM